MRQRAEWQQHYPDLQVAINVSAQDLENDDMVDRVVEELDRHALKAASLCFEMTERDIMNNADKTANTMTRLKALRFRTVRR
ncbi:MAG: EAL domain-containing protein [Gammaproteobacteria bacterium]|nr:EAL domain-containing protein [Gammaproteobacteria bacterium]